MYSAVTGFWFCLNRGCQIQSLKEINVAGHLGITQRAQVSDEVQDAFMPKANS